MVQLGDPRHHFKAGVGGTLGWMGYWLRSRARNALGAQERAWREREASYLPGYPTRPGEGLGVPDLGRRVVPTGVGS